MIAPITLVIFCINFLSDGNLQGSVHAFDPSGYHPTLADAGEKSIGDTVLTLGKSVFVIYQASNGHYWFGSNVDGVYRYDGKHIIRYTTSDGLSNHAIREIKEDKKGNIYFSTQHGGIHKYDGKEITILPVTKSHIPGTDWKLQKDDLWFKGETGHKGPYRYDGKTLYSLEFPKHYLADEYDAKYPDSAWSPYDVYYIYTDKAGNMWFGTSNFGVCRYDGKSLSWLYEDHLTDVAGGGSFGIRSIMEDKEGKYWFCNTQFRYTIPPNENPDAYHTQEGVNLMDYQKEKGIDGIKSSLTGDMFYFMSALEDDHGTMWMATYGEGVWNYNGKTITHYPLMDGSKVISLFSIYKDRQGDLWLGTHEYGAFKFNGRTFEKFNPKDS